MVAEARTQQNLDRSIRHRSNHFFHFRDVHHHDGVPRTAVQEASVRALAEALLASETQDGIHVDAPKRIMILVRHPEHAVFHRAIFHARRRPRAARAALGDDRKFFWFFLAWRGDAFGAGLLLLLVRHHPRGLGDFALGGHGRDYSLDSMLLEHPRESETRMTRERTRAHLARA